MKAHTKADYLRKRQRQQRSGFANRTLKLVRREYHYPRRRDGVRAAGGFRLVGHARDGNPVFAAIHQPEAFDYSKLKPPKRDEDTR